MPFIYLDKIKATSEHCKQLEGLQATYNGKKQLSTNKTKIRKIVPGKFIALTIPIQISLKISWSYIFKWGAPGFTTNTF